ncbi:MAG: class I SAM-dependent methyltransferase [Erythrobacteraceae bacterium]|jgi:hypothetical protein|nr:class I SAM-dependent methyltransferase [Erythrobacteraceae bacterium]
MTGLIADPANTKSLSYRFRSKRDKCLRDFLLQARSNTSGPCRIIDMGGGAAYWERVGLDWLVSNDFSVTCINYAATELTRDAVSAGPISLKVGDACDLSEFADDSFDIVHSNSVIEHVGSWAKMSGFAKEVRRLAPAYYVQTPNFWFPVDPHFYRVPMIHWLPPAARASVHCKVKAGWAGPAKDVDSGMRLAESNNMLSLTQMKHLFPDASFKFERVALLPKSIIATRTHRTN